jgi:hypothetical protein
VPQFLRFYGGYTVNKLMDERAITFFSLANAMYRIKADESLDRINTSSVPHMDKSGARSVIDGYKKQSKGLHGIIQEVRSIKP